MKKINLKLHCIHCGKKRYIDLFLQGPPNEDGKMETIFIKVSSFLKSIFSNDIKTKQKTKILKLATYKGICPICFCVTKYQINKNNKLVVIG